MEYFVLKFQVFLLVMLRMTSMFLVAPFFSSDLIPFRTRALFGLLVTMVIFPMVAKGRFDLFCRGINEVIDEWPEASQQPELVLEPAMMLYYDLPRFFYANSRDAKGLARVEEGLQLAAADGSLLALWKQYYLPSVEYVQPQKRQLFRLKNPDVNKIKWAPRQWVYDPISGAFHYRDQ